MNTKSKSSVIVSRPAVNPRRRLSTKEKQAHLARLIAAQGVKPAKYKDIAGRWPGDINDGFEEAVDRWRREEAGRDRR